MKHLLIVYHSQSGKNQRMADAVHRGATDAAIDGVDVRYRRCHEADTADLLWADANFDFVGIDNYLPLSDWRDGTNHLDAELWESARDAAYFRANIAAGERYDWYYASDADRDAQVRTPIADGAYGKPWV